MAEDGQRASAVALGVATAATGVAVGAFFLQYRPGDFAYAEPVATFASLLFLGAVAAFAFAPRAAHGAARDLLGAVLSTAVTIGVGGTWPEGGGFVAGALVVVDVVALALVPAFFLRASLAFPTRLAIVDRRPALMPSILGVGLAVGGARAAAWGLAFDGPASAQSVARVAEEVAKGWLVIGMAGGCAALAAGARRAPNGRARSQAWWLLGGIAVAATPFVFLRQLPELFGHRGGLLPGAVERLIEMAAPAAFAIAVMRHRLFDVDVVTRRHLLYSTIAALAALGVAGLVFVVGPWLAAPTEAVWAVSAALAVALYEPLRAAVGRFVDRTVFRIRTEHRRALAALRDSLARAEGQERAADVLKRFLAGAFAPKVAAAVVLVGDEARVRGDVPPAATDRGVLAALPRGGTAPVALRQCTARPDIEDPAFPEALSRAGVRIVVPLAREGRVLGWLLVGERATERRYVAEDVDLLVSAGEEAAAALDRLALVQEAAREAVARQALADLDRKKADFLLRVAHDLRTPLAGIRWSVENLLDGIGGPLSPGQAERLTEVKAAAQRLGLLVQNLLEISRLDIGAAPPTPESVDLAAVAEEAARTVRPVAEQKGVRVRVTTEPATPPVRGRRDKLFQVAMNLVDNATKYAPPDSVVEVEVAPDGADAVCLRVRDHGPGLPPSARSALFELFRQGTPSPHGGAAGFGIGLHVVKSWVEAFGGSVSAEDAPGGGARFACRLPRFSAGEGPS